MSPASSRIDPEQSPANGFYLPDLCRVRAVLLLLITTELVTLLFALVRAGNDWIDWRFFGLSSLFAQWVVLSAAALICALGRRLRQLDETRVTLVLLAVIAVDVLACSLFAQFFLDPGHWREGVQWLPLLRNLAIGLIVSIIVLRYFYLQHHWDLQKQAEADARVAALQARIHPHFLFNSMNTIASLILSRPTQAEDAVLDLSELFRASLRTQDRLISLDEELALCRRYLSIEQLRLAERLALDWDLDPATARQAIPPLTLQPLLENAVYHGIQPRPEGGCIHIQTRRQGNWVYVMIRNPLPTPETDRHQGNRMALANIRARLATLFQGEAILKQSRPDAGYTVTLRLPWRPLSAGETLT